ncbi:MAG: S-formylglutathione hydrolase [Pseudomonadota bacterium]
MSIQTLSEHHCFGGTVGYYAHSATSTGCDMRFAVYVPPQAAAAPVPTLTWLSGLTCTEETFIIKAGAQRVAAELGLMLLVPDTSPRGDDVPDDPEGAYDFGHGAGFYVNATREPWSTHYRMYDYIVDELPEIVFRAFPADRTRQGIFGHSMGGHGALTIGLRNPAVFSSISAFAPISNPTNCPWGEKALGGYLGDDRTVWADYDATELVSRMESPTLNPILVDQGLADEFLAEQLRPEAFERACGAAGVPLTLRRHADYDHGYFFVASFIEDHLRHHAQYLGT